MEWEKAKTLIIVFFVILNVVLAAFLFMENRRYTVTAEQESVIRTVLAQHGISMDTEMIRRFPPMRVLQVGGFYYDESFLLNIFFNDPARVVRHQSIYGVDFRLGDAELFVSGGFVDYFNSRGMDITPQEFIARYFPDFVHDEHYTPYDIEGQRIVFRQVYRGFIVYSNRIEFLVTDAGITEVVMQFGQIHGFDVFERAIFAPHEVLITFLQRVLAFTDDPVSITHIDIVYFIEAHHTSDEVGSVHHAIPFYRIFTAEFPMPFLINAYINVSIDV